MYPTLQFSALGKDLPGSPIGSPPTTPPRGSPAVRADSPSQGISQVLRSVFGFMSQEELTTVPLYEDRYSALNTAVVSIAPFFSVKSIDYVDTGRRGTGVLRFALQPVCGFFN